MPNANARLRPGMYARVSLNRGDTESIVIPDAAIVKQQGSGQRTVFVLKDDDTAEVRLVTLGKFFDGQYEVLEGLSEGDRVVSKGQASLRAGVKVEVVK